jgi:hypothetical protein
MPVTGAGADWLPLGALVLLALTLTAAGFAMRKSPAR